MPISVFLLELGVVAVGLAVLARVAHRLRISPIPLYLLAGLALGEGGVFPIVTAEEFIEFGAEIGVILLLFMLGLEYTAEELGASLKASRVAGLLDLGLNFTPGVVVGLLIGLGPVAAVLLGGITYMSSTGVIAKLLNDLHWLGNRETPVVLSMLVIEDLLMAVYLPIVAVLLRGAGLISSATSLGIALLAVLIVLAVAFRWGEHVSRLVLSRSDEALLLAIFGLILVVAGVAERLQVSAAVGAFLMGIALSGHAADRARIVLGPLRDLFAAVFFLFFGLRIDPASIPPVLGVALLLAAVTGLTKYATAWIAAARVGTGRTGRRRAGAIFISRGEFSIAIAGIGVAAGLGLEFGALAAAYVLILAMAGPLAARAVAGRPAPVESRRVGAAGTR